MQIELREYLTIFYAYLLLVSCQVLQISCRLFNIRIIIIIKQL